MSAIKTRQRIMFLTGTRADFGKLKSLLRSLVGHPGFEVHLFVTGMHMLSQYGSTYEEVENHDFPNIYKFINQNANDSMDVVLGKTVIGLSDYLTEIQPDLIVVHGDRVETLAGAIVGSLRNTRVIHIEGGEVSGTVDEVIRHAVSKLSHAHFVANEEARKRLLQLGEDDRSIFIIGSPDMDVMISGDLPSIDAVRQRYEITFDPYNILLFHPVTTEAEQIPWQVDQLLAALDDSGENYVIVYPNNDHGSQDILKAYDALKNHPNYRIIPSMRFEYFLTLMKHAGFVIGNSSAGVRETPFFGVPSVNIGSRQNKRAHAPTILNCGYDRESILRAIRRIPEAPRRKSDLFGSGGSARAFLEVMTGERFWNLPNQKHFIDMDGA